MKLVIFICLLSLLVSSCHETDSGNSIYHEYWLKNESGKTVTLYLYKKDSSLFSSIVALDSSLHLIDKGENDPGFGMQYYITNRLDSAQFIFSDGKKLVQTYLEKGLNDTINNVLAEAFYKPASTTENKRVLVFTLTPSDYNRSK